MGNQLAGIAPSQILPVEHYLTDVADYDFQRSLGSTRFLKVAKATYHEGDVVVKVFVIHDPSLPLKNYKDQVDDIKLRLFGASNCLPFQRTTLSDKAGLLFRQYVKDSLYDRISTRPFLNVLEKKWIAFQLLCAINQCHKLNVCHGDIKSENVMITSWNWLLLTDFASYKPTYLPEDNPADFSYYFDTSRRRTCYLAPERFVENYRASEAGNLDLTNSQVNNQGDLTPSMDIFSAGCVILELLTEGSVPFDLSQLLSYRVGEYSPWKILQKIQDTNMRDLVRSMTQKEASHRLSAEEYLIQQRGKAFPEYFYTFLKLYLQRFASLPVIPSNDRITRLKRDLEMVLDKIVSAPGVSSGNSEGSGIVLILSLITASVRDSHYPSAKLVFLELIETFCHHLTSDIILDRLVPFMLHLVKDVCPAVRADALRCLTRCLVTIKTVSRTDANIFPEYILQQTSALTTDAVTSVRVAYAENISQLAETALNFLEMIQLNRDDKDKDTADDSLHQVSSYDSELQTLHEIIQQKVVTLLCDTDNIVKRSILENGITRLCVFFGRQKANDVLLSHMITFLNDKTDWYLRASFFDTIVGVVAYIGWHSSTILKPILQQGLSDCEEFVMHKALVAVTTLTGLGLLEKIILHDLLKEIIPLFCHPNVWIRHGAVGFVSAVAKNLNIADIHCNLMPQIKPFLKQPVIQIDQEVVLLNGLTDSIPRAAYDFILKSNDINKIFDTLEERHMIRKLSRSGHQPNYPVLDESIGQVIRKLHSQGMSELDEDRLLAIKDTMLKINNGRSGISTDLSDFEESGPLKNGGVELSHVNITRRHADFGKPDVKDSHVTTKKSNKKKTTASESTVSSMNEEWKHMFYEEEITKTKPRNMSTKHKGSSGADPSGSSLNQSIAVGTMSMSQLKSSVEGIQSTSASPTKKSSNTSNSSKPDRNSSHFQSRFSSCKIELRTLVHEKRDQYVTDCTVKGLVEGVGVNSGYSEDRQPPAYWKPKGLLVAHLHEHRAAINRIQVNADNTYFASCSDDGTMKLWECDRIEGRSATNRSKYTYNKQGGQIKCLEFCDSSNVISTASDNGSIHIFRPDVESNQVVMETTEQINLDELGHVVDMKSLNTGPHCLLTFASVNGYIVALDARSKSSETAWKLKNNPKLGLITSYNIHTSQSWLSVGTSGGQFVVWDLRFQLPITTVTHPTGARVRRMLMHPSENSQIITSVQGNNEVSFWDMENGSRLKTLWASSAPALSTTQASNHSSNGVYIGGHDNMFMLTAGSDMRIRYWNINNPEMSAIVVGGATDPVNQATVVSYRTQYIDGTQVIQEMYSKVKGSRNEEFPRHGPDAPPIGHHDTITDITFLTSQYFFVTSSRDGVIKVWK